MFVFEAFEEKPGFACFWFVCDFIGCFVGGRFSGFFYYLTEFYVCRAARYRRHRGRNDMGVFFFAVLCLLAAAAAVSVSAEGLVQLRYSSSGPEGE